MRNISLRLPCHRHLQKNSSHLRKASRRPSPPHPGNFWLPGQELIAFQQYVSRVLGTEAQPAGMKTVEEERLPENPVTIRAGQVSCSFPTLCKDWRCFSLPDVMLYARYMHCEIFLQALRVACLGHLNERWCLAFLRMGASSEVGQAAFPQHLLEAP